MSKKGKFFVSSLDLILCLPRKNILYASITNRPQTFTMVASGVQIISFNLISNLRRVKLLQDCRVTML